MSPYTLHKPRSSNFPPGGYLSGHTLFNDEVYDEQHLETFAKLGMAFQTGDSVELLFKNFFEIPAFLF